MNKSKSGFTIVELLIVIVVIGILAAITIVAYNGIQNRANNSAVQSDLSMLGKRFELFYADKDRYPNAVSELEDMKVKLSRSSYLTDSTIASNIVICLPADNLNYSIAAVTKSGTRLFIAKGRPVTEYTGATSWLGATNYTNMCNTTLAGSAALGLGSAWSTTWRTWSGV